MINKRIIGEKFVFFIPFFFIIIIIPLLTHLNETFPIALLIGIIFFLFFLKDLKYGLYIFAFAYPLISFIERGLVIPGLALNEVLLIIISVLFVFNVFIGKYTLKRNGLLVPFLIFYFCEGFVPLFVSIFNKQILTLKIILQFFASGQYYLILILFQNVIEDEKSKKTLLFWILGGSAVVAIMGIFQWFDIFNMDDFIFRVYTMEWKDILEREVSRFEVARRVTSTLNNWNGCGAYLGGTILIAFFLLRLVKSVTSKFIILSIVAINAICLVLTFSFTSYIMAVVMLVTFGFLMRRLRLVFYFSVIFIISIIILSPFFESRMEMQFGYGGWIPHSMLVRYEIWTDDMLPQIMEGPLLGVGADYYNLSHTAESFYFFLLLRGGLLLFCAFFFLLFKMIYEINKNIKITDDEFARSSGKLILSLLVAIFLGNFTEPYFRFAGVAELIWILLAISYPSTGRIYASPTNSNEKKSQLI